MHGLAGEPALQARSVGATYDGRAAIRDVTLQIEPGELVALVGPNGAGKSTLMRCLLGLQRHDGEVVVHGRAAFVPQRAEIDLDFPITVGQLVLGGRRRFRRTWQRPARTDRLAATEALGDVGLTGLERRGLREISGGQLQRVLLARALVSEADVLLLDEPLLGVDIRGADVLLSLLVSLAGAGRAVLVATHDLHLVHERFARCLALNGRLVADGTPGEALSAHGLEQLFQAAA